MLRYLVIKNYVLIDKLEIDFGKGFSVITGETGAGKSIILGALSLILGQRADAQSIKHGESKCVIEAEFDVSAYDLREFCELNELEYDPQSYIIRREIFDTGRSRAFVNDSPVSLGDLKKLGEQLIDIHSQHQNMLLADEVYQLRLLDVYSKAKEPLADYRKAYTEYKMVSDALTDLKKQLAQQSEEENFIRYQLELLEKAVLREGEQAELEQEQELLDNAEQIKSGLYKISCLLGNEESGVVTNLKTALGTSAGLQTVYKKAEEIAERIDSAFIDLKDLNGDINRMIENVEYNPQRLEQVRERLNLLYDLQQRFKMSSEQELIQFFNDLQLRLAEIDLADDKIKVLEADLEIKTNELTKYANLLTQCRQAAAKDFSNELTLMVANLGMAAARVQFVVTPKTPDLSGADHLEILFSSAKNLPMQPVAKIASGGELSRMMLCLKSIIAGSLALPTIIFDEIDTGVSGEIADKMGLIMTELGQKMQVIAITHLPQIAAKGIDHFKVYKSDIGNGQVRSGLRKLSDQERVNEIAGMLSGSVITDAALLNAREMIGKK